MHLVKSGSLIAIYTLLSRIFGLFRELVIAHYLGTSWIADSVNAAFKFPNLFRRSFAEGALTSAFVPIYTSHLVIDKNHTSSRATHFAQETFTWLLLVLTLITIVLEVMMPFVIMVIAPGFASNKEKLDLTILLCRITTPYLILISLSALLGSIKNSHNKFALFAFVPILLNVAVIIAACYGDLIYADSEYSHAINISAGVLLGGIMQLGTMMFFTHNSEVHFRIVNITKISDDARVFLKNFLPAIISSSATQINLFISQGIASFASGAISILSYSDRIYQFPLSIIGICFGTILLPMLSRLHEKGDLEASIDLQDKSIRLGAFLSIGAAFGIMSLAHPIMYVIYERGAFTPEDTINTAECVSIFALGLPAFILVKILTPIFYARKNTESPMEITLITIVANCVINCLLVSLGMGPNGIAFGTSIAGWINVALLVWYCKRAKISIAHDGLLSYISKLLLISAIMTFTLYCGCEYFYENLYSDESIISILTLLSLVITGGVVFISSSIALKAISFDDIKLLLRR